MNKKDFKIKLKKLLMESKLKEKEVKNEFMLVMKRGYSYSNFYKKEDGDSDVSEKEIINILSEKYETLNTIIEDIGVENIDYVELHYKGRSFAPYIPKDFIEIDIEINFYKTY
jgi:cell fate (sporulation/competence/biofilm development) regulator YlbF (YheA/YmcA/DUF963 family)